MRLSGQMIGHNLSLSNGPDWAELAVRGMLVITLKDTRRFN